MTRARLFAGLSALCNLAVIAAVAWAVARRFSKPEDGGSRFLHGVRGFRFFTTDSNLLAALACLCVLPFSLRGVSGGGYEVPAFARTAKYIGVCAVTLTFLTVVCFLAPTQGWLPMFSGPNLWLHLLCPLLCTLSFLLFESQEVIGFPVTFAALIPIALYGAVYLYAVVVQARWEDFYGFNRSGRWYVALPVMLSVSYLICLGEWGLSRLLHGVLFQ